jgi:Protein of unknown function (DUF4089)
MTLSLPVDSLPPDPEVNVDALAPLAGFHIEPDFRHGIVANVALMARMARVVLEFPLGDHEDPAPIFEA